MQKKSHHGDATYASIRRALQEAFVKDPPRRIPVYQESDGEWRVTNKESEGWLVNMDRYERFLELPIETQDVIIGACVDLANSVRKCGPVMAFETIMYCIEKNCKETA